MWTIPNILSLLRIALIPVLILVYLLPSPSAAMWSAIVFMVAGFTDALDGYLARRWQQTSAFGAFIDPVADKLLVAIALLLILYRIPTWYILLPVLVIISREITVSALREWMAELGERQQVQVSSLGKMKTAFQMLSITCLLYAQPLLGLPLLEVGIGLLYFAAVLTISSMISYLKAAWPTLQARR
ncbi:MAG TPA: CDP-diacylglycerol--glycerol-3-phosphate 3-phosphatidyltransferase [Gammaproteobacteria bacterium]|nr:CDP-diacylglycerol--glycerol-3-phosphate 3-phosphatidyltransferase [Gammaproteobacteria bacterium]